jgi:hypothetical protein
MAKRKLDPAERLLFWGAVITVPLTTLTATFFTFLRETRILFPPFIFVVPLTLKALMPIWQYARERWYLGGWATAIGVVTVLIALGISNAEHIWTVFEYRQSSELRRIFAGVNLGLSATLLLALLHKRIYSST